MSVVNQLSSQVGDKTQEANRAAAMQCLDNPTVLAEVAEALSGKDPVLLGDCCEVMTKVAEQRPELVVPYVDLMVPLLAHKVTKVRWEAMHALALAAERVPVTMASLLPRLAEIIQRDSSTIVRDYTVDAVGNMAKADEGAALLAYPVLRDAMHAWEGKHLGRVLAGLSNVARNVPAVAPEIVQVAHDYMEHEKSIVRKAAKALLKAAKH